MEKFVIDTTVAAVPTYCSPVMYGRVWPTEVIVHKGSKETVIEVDGENIFIDGCPLTENGTDGNLNALRFILGNHLMPEKMYDEANKERCSGNVWCSSFRGTEICMKYMKLIPCIVFAPDMGVFELGWFHPNGPSSDYYLVRGNGGRVELVSMYSIMNQ